IRSSRPTQSQRCVKIFSCSSAKISGDVKYSRGSVFAALTGICVVLRNVVTARTPARVQAEDVTGAGGRKARARLRDAPLLGSVFARRLTAWLLQESAAHSAEDELWQPRMAL